jgi:hypothetical protein
MVELPGTDDSDVRIRRLFELISKTETEAASKHLLLTIAAPVYPPETTVLLVLSLQIQLAHSMKVLSTSRTLKTPRAWNTGGVVPFSVA